MSIEFRRQNIHPTCIEWELFSHDMGGEYNRMINKKAHMQEFQKKELTTVEGVSRSFAGFDQTDIGDIEQQIKMLTDELNQKIQGVFSAKVDQKIEKMKCQTNKTASLYGERTGMLNAEYQKMNDRFDYLKMREYQIVKSIETCMFNTEKTNLLRKALNGFRSETKNSKSYRLRKEKMRQWHHNKLRQKLFFFWKKYVLLYNKN